MACPVGLPESAVPRTMPLERGNQGARVAVAEKEEMVVWPMVAMTL